MPDYFFNYFLFTSGHAVLIQQRLKKDVWQQLWEFPMIEGEKLLSSKEAENSLVQGYPAIGMFNVIKISDSSQQLTHQKIFTRFFQVEAPEKFETPGAYWSPLGELKHYAFPRVIRTFIDADPIFASHR